MKNKFSMLALLIIICLTVEALGGFFTAAGVHDWYLTLKKPSFNPPSYAFAPVWTSLYLFMAFAMWLVWLTPAAKSKTPAYACFSIQLLLNLAWSALFFTFRCPLCALIDIGLLLISILATMRCFQLIRPLAAYLMLPYFLWVVFAAYLNATIWWLNS